MFTATNSDSEPAVVLPDGGEEEADDEAEESSEESEEDEEMAEEEAEEAPEGEEEEEEEEEEEADDSEGAQLVHLNLEGLFLDVLGLEVDLDEVNLGVTAAEGSNNLLGNLLSSVSGLLDGGLGGLLDLGLPDDGLFGDGDGITGRISKWVRGALSSIVDELPIEKVIQQLVDGLVDQLLDGEGSEG